MKPTNFSRYIILLAIAFAGVIGGSVYFFSPKLPLVATLFAVGAVVILFFIFTSIERNSLNQFYLASKELAKQDGSKLGMRIRCFWVNFSSKDRRSYINYIAEVANHNTLQQLLLSKPMFLGTNVLEFLYSEWERKALDIQIINIDATGRLQSVLGEYAHLKEIDFGYRLRYEQTADSIVLLSQNILNCFKEEFSRTQTLPYTDLARANVFSKYCNQFIQPLALHKTKIPELESIFQDQFSQTGKVLHKEEIEVIVRNFIFSKATNNTLLDLLDLPFRQTQGYLSS